MAVIFIDHYVLPKRTVNDAISDKVRDFDRRKPKGYMYYINTESGNRYSVSRKTYNDLAEGIPVTLRKTALFRKNVTMSWCIEKRCYETSLQGFLDKYTGALLLLVPFILLLPGLFGFVNISSGSAQLVYYFGLVWAIFTIVIFFAS